MAEIYLSVVAEGILSKVLSLAIEELSLVWGFKGLLERLAERIEMVRALLSDAEKKPIGMDSLQFWLKKLEAIVYSVDIVLDEFTYEVLRRKVEMKDRMKDKVTELFSPSKNPLTFRWMMANKIRNISLLLDEIYKEAIAPQIGLRIELINSNTANVDDLREIRQTHPYVDDSEVVGRDKDMSIIVEMLVDSSNEKDLSAISILGMPGQGKTTLAQMVYKNEMVVRNFDERIWVSVSNDFRVTRILNEMVQSLTRTNSQMSSLEAIIKRLEDILKGKKYLLVLDDVWNEIPEKWDFMRKSLLGIGGLRGSQIMVTTRSDIVVSIVQPFLTHRLEGLSDEDSWALFKQKVFVDGGAIETPNLEDIGRDIVKRCGGVPLAIKAAGGVVLHAKKSEHEWLSIQNSHMWDLPENVSGILPTLKLSYDYLPSSSLKQCFAYSSVIPKSYVIGKNRIIQLWMALGLLNPPKGSHLAMEDVGSYYFNTLLWNSLFQDAKKDEDENITSCKMHDLVHELAELVSKNYCLNLEGSNVNDVSGAIHLSWTFATGIIPEKSKKGFQRLQTLYIKGGVIGNMITIMKCLRVLILVSNDIEDLPSSIGKLKHLRYLDISMTRVHKLPDNIVKLYNLQTLRVNYLEELPKNFANLISLRHFCIDRTQLSSDCTFTGVGRLTCLQTLPLFVVSQEKGCQIEELGGLNNLQAELKIYGLEDVRNMEEARNANISSKSNIHTLGFHWGFGFMNEGVSEEKDVLEGLQPHSNLKRLTVENFTGGNFSSWMMMESKSSLVLHNLVRIKLDNCSGCEQIPTLGHLPYLKVVEIIGMDHVKRIGTEFYGTHIGAHVTIFPALRELILLSMPELEEWLEAVHLSTSFKVFPQLEVLKIVGCYSLIAVPSQFPSITKLTISGINNSQPLEDLLRNKTTLQELKIYTCHELPRLPNNIQNLVSLRRLEVSSCLIFTDLPSGLQFCTSLERLTIRKCPALRYLLDIRSLISLRRLDMGLFSEELDYFPWPFYTPTTNSFASSLKELTLIGWPKLKSLAKQLQQLSALTDLSICEFDGLEALPEWLGNLSSLQSLNIFSCEKLMYLPTLEAMRRLSKLQNLQVHKNCRLLIERCTEGSGPEWHKIAHITQRNFQF